MTIKQVNEYVKLLHRTSISKPDILLPLIFNVVYDTVNAINTHFICKITSALVYKYGAVLDTSAIAFVNTSYICPSVRPSIYLPMYIDFDTSVFSLSAPCNEHPCGSRRRRQYL